MNYYNPYFFNIPTNNTGLFSRLFGNIKLSSILSGANKTLNFVNQTIPVIKQISPIVKNARTMFNVINEFKKVDETKNISKNDINQKNINQNKLKENSNINKPTFFIN